MNNKILLTMLVVFAVIFSVSAVSASDVNVTDSYTTSLVDDTSDVSVPMENTADSSVISVSSYSNVDNDSSKVSLSSEEVLESENSNTLSTDTNSNSLQSSVKLGTTNKESGLSDFLGANKASTGLDTSKSIVAKNIAKFYKGSTKYTATFLDGQGKVLSNTKVKITVDGKTYTRTTNAKGVAALTINLKPATYKVVAHNPVTGYELTTTFRVVSTIKAVNMNKVYTDKKKYTVTFFKSNGKVLANKNVKFKINGKTYTRKTNANGVAALSLIDLPTGSYKITSYNVDGLTKTKTVKVVRRCSSKLIASDYTFLHSNKKVIKVTLHNQFNYAPGPGKTIRFTVNGVNYYKDTNSKGVAAITLPNLKNGVYAVKYYYAGNDFYTKSSAKSKLTIIPTKVPTYTVKTTTTFGSGAKTMLKIALTSGSVPLGGRVVTLKVDGSKTYTKTTTKNGLFGLTINLPIGKHTISYSNKAGNKVSAKSGSVAITVKERTTTSLAWKSATSFNAGSQTLKVLLSASNKPLSGKTVQLTANNKNYTATTDSSGYATFKASLGRGNFALSYSFAGDNDYKPISKSTKVKVTAPTSISINNILKAAATVKSYYASNGKIPASVTAGGYKYTVPEFLYLMAKAIYQLGNSNTKAVSCLYDIKKPSKPTGDKIYSAELYRSDYLKVAKNLFNYIKNNKQAPNYSSSAVGNIIYDEVVDAFSRILTFYKENNKYMPDYCVIKYGSDSGGGGSFTPGGVNFKNTIKNLAPYLKATTNCQVTNSAIKKKAASLTSGLSSVKEKALAIYNYVRDQVSYSFYYDTAYGATGTLSRGYGNCVDQAHLVVALCRAAGIPAMYEHGTCRFTSGSTYGHVWALVLVNNVWVAADPTSSRNLLGTINNWYTSSYTHHSYYRSLPF